MVILLPFNKGSLFMIEATSNQITTTFTEFLLFTSKLPCGKEREKQRHPHHQAARSMLTHTWAAWDQSKGTKVHLQPGTVEQDLPIQVLFSPTEQMHLKLPGLCVYHCHFQFHFTATLENFKTLFNLGCFYLYSD